MEENICKLLFDLAKSIPIVEKIELLCYNGKRNLKKGGKSECQIKLEFHQNAC
jgi:hypothetical protein